MVTNDYVTIANEKMEDEFIKRHHKHDVKEHQCSSSLVKHIKAHVPAVWSLVRRFDQPQEYKPFVSRCIVQGDVRIGSVREVNVKSGLPATTSTERLELLDDDKHIFGMKIVGGDHRLKNYSSIVTVHPEVIDGRPGTLVIESFVVDVPDGNTEDETCYFVEALIKCNLKSLADVSERLAVQRCKVFVVRVLASKRHDHGLPEETRIKNDKLTFCSHPERKCKNSGFKL
ncbi:hypothetical protein OIU74_013085 [Salix koriyanagi]|uniref:Uncharacterized protein n=1 Tax=Salix koriyanagi TaxID=2511006 RepID=A0A9Q0Q8C0_9ROSI|nr:hypothetical protein OIU74_013085 [Salix koriyanagi]